MARKPTRKSLGKGLRALIPESPAVPDSGPAKFADVPVNQVLTNPYQPRLQTEPEKMEELIQSIKSNGIIQPVTVSRSGSSYMLISGERRWRACQALGLDTIPAYILEVETKEQLLELSLIENLQREDLNAIEIATSYQRLIEECGLTHQEVADIIGVNRSTVSNFLRLLQLPEVVKIKLQAGDITSGHARALLPLSDHHIQQKLLEKILREGLSVRQVEALVSSQSQKPKTKSLTSASTKGDDGHDPIRTELENQLQYLFGTRVTIHQTQDRGRISLEFYSQDDLDRIITLLRSIENSL